MQLPRNAIPLFQHRLYPLGLLHAPCLLDIEHFQNANDEHDDGKSRKASQQLDGQAGPLKKRLRVQNTRREKVRVRDHETAGDREQAERQHRHVQHRQQPGRAHATKLVGLAA